MTGRAWAALDSAVGRRVSAGRLGEQLGRLGLWPVQDRSVAWFQPTAELPAASSPPAQHPRQGRERLTARPTPGRASYAADVSRCLETLMRCQDWNDRHRTPATCRARSTAAQSRSSGDSPATLRRPHNDRSVRIGALRGGSLLAVPTLEDACAWDAIAPIGTRARPTGPARDSIASHPMSAAILLAWKAFHLTAFPVPARGGPHRVR
jgi:hypothetical protein